MRVLLDSSAVLAVLYREPGAERVAAALIDAEIGSVNAAEVLRVLARDFGGPEEAVVVLSTLKLPVVDFTAADAVEAARVSQVAPELSLGDCACLAVAKRRGADAVLTADRIWAKYDFGVPVTLLR